MKKIIKRPVLLLISLFIMLSLTACGNGNDKIQYDEAQVDQVTKTVITFMQQYVNPNLADTIAAADSEDLEAFEEEIGSMGLNIKGSAFKDGYGSYISAVQGDLGEIVSVADKAEVSSDDESIKSDITVTGTKTFPDGSPRTATVEVLMTKRGTVTSVAYNVDRTFGEKIVNAALNTVLGMGTTFCLLIFISIVIWLMGTIVQNMEKSRQEKERSAETTADHVAEQIAAREEQSAKSSTPASDTELIAVISAAIASYESAVRGVNVTPDTFIVRSLRRR